MEMPFVLRKGKKKTEEERSRPRQRKGRKRSLARRALAKGKINNQNQTEDSGLYSGIKHPYSGGGNTDFLVENENLMWFSCEKGSNVDGDYVDDVMDLSNRMVESCDNPLWLPPRHTRGNVSDGCIDGRIASSQKHQQHCHPSINPQIYWGAGSGGGGTKSNEYCMNYDHVEDLSPWVVARLLPPGLLSPSPMKRNDFFWPKNTNEALEEAEERFRLSERALADSGKVGSKGDADESSDLEEERKKWKEWAVAVAEIERQRRISELSRLADEEADERLKRQQWAIHAIEEERARRTMQQVLRAMVSTSRFVNTESGFSGSESMEQYEVVCPNSVLGCDACCLRADVQKHLLEECRYGPAHEKEEKGERERSLAMVLAAMEEERKRRMDAEENEGWRNDKTAREARGFLHTLLERQSRQGVLLLCKELEIIVEKMINEQIEFRPVLDAIVASIDKAVHELWPEEGVRVVAYGSYETGLMTKESDVDIMVTFDSPLEVTTTSSSRSSNMKLAHHELSSSDLWVRGTTEMAAQFTSYCNGNNSNLVGRGSRSTAAFPQFQASTAGTGTLNRFLLEDLATHLSENVPGMTVSTLLLHTRIPVIKAEVEVKKFVPDEKSIIREDMARKVRVDVSFDEAPHSGIATTAMVKFLVEHKPLFKPLVLVLKALLRNTGLTVRPSGGIPSYSLNLMALFSLLRGGGRATVERSTPPPTTPRPPPPPPASIEHLKRSRNKTWNRASQQLWVGMRVGRALLMQDAFASALGPYFQTTSTRKDEKLHDDELVGKCIVCADDGQQHCLDSGTTTIRCRCNKKEGDPTLGEAFLAFLRFFGSDFDAENEGFSVRGGGFCFWLGQEGAPAASHDRGRGVVIEDPLNLTNNPGCNLYNIRQVQACLTDALTTIMRNMVRVDLDQKDATLSICETLFNRES